ncbi:MAG: Mce-associated rane protein, partial [Streptomyces sp.]|nr:Mce-associated rane protein [Streptomyces sp.]
MVTNMAAAARAAAKRVERAELVEPVKPAGPAGRVVHVYPVQDEASAPARPRLGLRPRPRPRIPVRIRAGALALLLVGGLVAATFLGLAYRDAERTGQARTQAVAAARNAAPVILSYDYRHLGRDFTAARTHL